MDTKAISEITLSYTFYPSGDAGAGESGKSGS
jgi:hypothetical protein